MPTLTPRIMGMVAERFKALAEPVRLRLLEALRGGERSVTELVEVTGLGQANVSKHLHTLHTLEFVTRRKEGLHAYYALAAYLVHGRTGLEEGRIGWASARNLPTDDPELAATLMRATAAQNVRGEKPVYHLAMAFDPGDPVDRATMERVADRVLARLRLEEHQALIVSHRDREHAHLHILVNRVHPESGRLWDRWQDMPTIQQVLREEERALGRSRIRLVPARCSIAPHAPRGSRPLPQVNMRCPVSVEICPPSMRSSEGSAKPSGG
jgi:DNA-binding transcriptional ArsR family regulator